MFFSPYLSTTLQNKVTALFFAFHPPRPPLTWKLNRNINESETCIHTLPIIVNLENYLVMKCTNLLVIHLPQLVLHLKHWNQYFCDYRFCRRLYCHHKTYSIYRLRLLLPEFKCLICGNVQGILTSNRYFHVSLGLPLWSQLEETWQHKSGAAGLLSASC